MVVWRKRRLSTSGAVVERESWWWCFAGAVVDAEMEKVRPRRRFPGFMERGYPIAGAGKSRNSIRKCLGRKLQITSSQATALDEALTRATSTRDTHFTHLIHHGRDTSTVDVFP